MAELFNSPLAQIVFLLALTAALIAVGAYVIGKVRAGLRGGAPESSLWMTNFKEMHSQGELSDQEFRTIKAMLAERLQHEVSDANKPR